MRRVIAIGRSRVLIFRSREAAVLISMLALSFAVVSAILGAPGAQAHFDNSGKYSHSTNACTSTTNRVDPVMIVFYWNGDAVPIRTHVEHHLNWFNQEGSTQHYKIHANPVECGENSPASQRASAGGNDDRYHIRFKETFHGDAQLAQTSLATPHQEEHVYFNGCGVTGSHAVFEPYGFQNGRTVVYNAFVPSGGHTHLQTVVWGNTQLMEQCNGNMVGSLDGKVDFIRIP